MRTTGVGDSVDDCLEAARGAATLARQAYRAIVPVGEGLADAADRVGPVSPTRPPSPLLDAVVTLAVASAAGERAVTLTVAHPGAAQVDAVTAALHETARSARLGVLSLQVADARQPRIQLAHASGYACHLITDSMIMDDEYPARSRKDPHTSVQRSPFPQAWRALIAALGTWLAQNPNDAVPDGPRLAVVAAYAGAEHIARAYDRVSPVNGAVGAVRRYARISALAAAYCGWSGVDVAETDIASAT